MLKVKAATSGADWDTAWVMIRTHEMYIYDERDRTVLLTTIPLTGQVGGTGERGLEIWLGVFFLFYFFCC